MISDWPAWEAQFLSFVRDSAQSADVAHDLEHIRRVVGNARAIAAAEGGMLEVVIPAAWLHDCVVLPKDSGERASASRLAAEAATAFLKEIDFPVEYLAGIAHAIEAHSFTVNIPPETLEAHSGPAGAQRSFGGDVFAQDGCAAIVARGLDFAQNDHRVPDAFG
jgi:uncharacterized protein